MKAVCIIMWIIGTIVALEIFCALVLIIAGLLVNTKKEYTKENKFYRFLLNFGAACTIFGTRTRMKVIGKEKLPKEGRMLFVCNHRSNFDPIFTWLALRKYHISFVSKEANFHIPAFGRIIRKCCFLSIDREDPRSSMKTLMTAADLITRDEVSIGIYPEGTRNMNYKEGLLPFHNGVFKIAQKSKVPIAILAISGTETIAGNFPKHGSKVTLEVVKVIDAEQVTTLRSGEIGELVRDEIEKALSK